MIVLLLLASLLVPAPAWALSVRDVLAWKHPTADWTYQGDGSSLDAHRVKGQQAYGLIWRSAPAIPRPTLADVQAWAAAMPAPVPLRERLDKATTLDEVKTILKERLR